MRQLILLAAIVLTCCQPKADDRFTVIRGKSQHIIDMGSGKPVVVFISGFGDRVSSWMHVQKKVAELTRTLSYDRAGLGESEKLGKNRSLDSLIFELTELLHAESIKPPYILVGHSYGGHIARYFAHKHPDEVVGILLVDPTVEYMKDEFKRLKTASEVRKYDSLSEHGRDPAWKEGVRNEADYFHENNDKMKEIDFNAKLPTTVITAMNMSEPTFDFLKGVNEMKVTLHQRWAREAPH